MNNEMHQKWKARCNNPNRGNNSGRNELIIKANFEVLYAKTTERILVKITLRHNQEIKWSGKFRFLRRSCTSGYKHETFRLCSSNLSCKYFLVSHFKFFPFSRELTEISKWLPNSYVKKS